MTRLTSFLLTFALLVPVGTTRAQDDQASKTAQKETAQEKQDDARPKTPAELLRELEGEYRAAYSKWMQEVRAGAADGKAVDMTTRPKPESFAPKFMAFAKEHAGDHAAANALLWVIRSVEDEQLIAEAFDKVIQDHAFSLTIACETLGLKPTATSERLLRQTIKDNTDHETVGKSHYALARLLKRVDQFAVVLGDEERTAQFEQYYGPERVAWLKKKGTEANRREIEKLFVKIKEQYGDIRSGNGTLADVADRELFEIRNLAVGCTVPEIEAEDIDGVEFKISDYRGKVILLDFWGDW